MSTWRGWIVGAGLLILAAAILLVVTGSHEGAGPSVLSRGPLGWQIAHNYVVARDASAELLDRPFGPDIHWASAVVIAAPLQRGFDDDELSRLDSFVRSGGTLIWAFSRTRLSVFEAQLAELLALETNQCGTDPPLGPIAWWRHQKRTVELIPVGAGRQVRRIVTRPQQWFPETDPERVQVLYKDEDGRPAVFRLDRGKGQALLLPAEALSNCRLANPGNADLLETLLALAGDRWIFDELRHGLAAADIDRTTPAQRVLDLLLLHIILIYVLAVWALGRRFGPPWRLRATAFGSTATFLLGLGRLHDRLGHHAEATARLIERAKELDPRLQLGSPPAGAGGRARLLALARWLGRQQQGGGRLTTKD